MRAGVRLLNPAPPMPWSMQSRPWSMRSMRSESKMRGFAVPGVVALALILLAAAPGARAQVMRYLGSITVISGDTHIGVTQTLPDATATGRAQPSATPAVITGRTLPTRPVPDRRPITNPPPSIATAAARHASGVAASPPASSRSPRPPEPGVGNLH